MTEEQKDELAEALMKVLPFYPPIPPGACDLKLDQDFYKANPGIFARDPKKAAFDLGQEVFRLGPEETRGLTRRARFYPKTGKIKVTVSNAPPPGADALLIRYLEREGLLGQGRQNRPPEGHSGP